MFSPLQTLTELLVAKGVLNDAEAEEIKDIYSLVSVVEGAVKTFANPDELAFIKHLKTLLDNKDFKSIKTMNVPVSLTKIHQTAIKFEDFLNKGSVH